MRVSAAALLLVTLSPSSPRGADAFGSGLGRLFQAGGPGGASSPGGAPPASAEIPAGGAVAEGGAETGADAFGEDANDARGSTNPPPSSVAGFSRRTTLYDVLRCPPDATRAELKRSYAALARETHPDALVGRVDSSFPPPLASNGGSDDDSPPPDFNEVARAYKILSDPRERLRYDRSLRAEAFADEIARTVENAADRTVRAAAPGVKGFLENVAVPLFRRPAAVAAAAVEAAREDLNGTAGGGGAPNVGTALLSVFRASRSAGRAIDELESLERLEELERKKAEAADKADRADRLLDALSDMDQRIKRAIGGGTDDPDARRAELMERSEELERRAAEVAEEADRANELLEALSQQLALRAASAGAEADAEASAVATGASSSGEELDRIGAAAPTAAGGVQKQGLDAESVATAAADGAASALAAAAASSSLEDVVKLDGVGAAAPATAAAPAAAEGPQKLAAPASDREGVGAPASAAPAPETEAAAAALLAPDGPSAERNVAAAPAPFVVDGAPTPPETPKPKLADQLSDFAPVPRFKPKLAEQLSDFVPVPRFGGKSAGLSSALSDVADRTSLDDDQEENEPARVDAAAWWEESRPPPPPPMPRFVPAGPAATNDAARAPLLGSVPSTAAAPPPALATPAADSSGGIFPKMVVPRGGLARGEPVAEAPSRNIVDPRDLWDASFSQTVQGDALKTWSFPNAPTSSAERLLVLLKSDGCPLSATFDLWQGPDNTPQRMRIYSEDGSEHPFSAVVETAGAQSTVAVRNKGEMEFPLEACVKADGGESPSAAAAASRGGSTGLGAVAASLSESTIPRIVRGGAVYTKPIDPSVASVRLLLKTDGCPMNARIELLRGGPNGRKQTIELYAEDGTERPFFAILQTPGSGNAVRITNPASGEFPLAAWVEPHLMESGGVDEGPADSEVGSGGESGGHFRVLGHQWSSGEVL